MTDHDHLAARKLRNESNGNVGLCPLDLLLITWFLSIHKMSFFGSLGYFGKSNSKLHTKAVRSCGRGQQRSQIRRRHEFLFWHREPSPAYAMVCVDGGLTGIFFDQKPWIPLSRVLSASVYQFTNGPPGLSDDGSGVLGQ
ncbi:hypothetical protein PVK06_049948 [Gossypium arboreum]|uniref:Uncharacterized protein n=1 Tax=Gossypium arboreum TaxID=29729 RepID=A0ABR0M9X6_GOSAR|nr:hypothetical protein PVK06_049948 [Gossypium arboreum]